MPDEDLEYEKMMRDVRKFRRQSPAASPGPASTPVVIPPVLYLPMRESAPGEHVAEIRETPDGRKMLIAYTALDRLLERCGPAQPWILMQSEEVVTIREKQPFDAVSFDPYFTEQYRKDGKLA